MSAVQQWMQKTLVNPINEVDFWVGAMFVIIFALGRFERPIARLRGVDWARYLSYLLLYAATSLMALTGLSIVLSAMPSHWIEAMNLAQWLSPKWQEFSPPLLATLMLTVLLPNTPYLKNIDEAVRRCFVRRAAISHYAASWSRALRVGALIINETSHARLQEIFKGNGHSASDIATDKHEEREPHHAWTRITILWDAVEGWRSHDSDYRDFVIRSEAEFGELKQCHQALLNEAHYCFLLHRAVARRNDLRRALSHCREYYTNDIQKFLVRLCDFTSRGIIQTHGTYATRCSAMRNLGITPPLKVGLSASDFIRIVLVLLLALVAAFSIAANLLPAEREVVGNQLPLIAMIVTNWVVAIWFASVSTRFFPSAAANDRWPAYLLAGLLSAAVAAAVAFVFHLPKSSGWENAIDRVIDSSSPYLLIPFVVAISCAFLMERTPGASKPLLRLRVVDGAVLAVAAGVAAAMASGVLDARAPPQVLIPTTSLLGFLVGVTVPTWYRQCLQRNAAESAESDQAIRPSRPAPVTPANVSSRLSSVKPRTAI